MRVSSVPGTLYFFLSAYHHQRQLLGEPGNQVPSSKNKAPTSVLGLVVVNFGPCFVLGIATSRSRYLIGLGARQRMTRRRGRFAYAVEDRTCWLSFIVLTRRALPIHTCFGRECVILNECDAIATTFECQRFSTVRGSGRPGLKIRELSLGHPLPRTDSIRLRATAKVLNAPAVRRHAHTEQSLNSAESRRVVLMGSEV